MNDSPPNRKLLKKILISGLIILLVLTVVGGILYYNLKNSVRTIDTEDLLNENNPTETVTTPAPTRDPFADERVNILILGSDSRDENDASKDARSDSTLVLSVSKDRKDATVVSIPRDSMVKIPSCKQSNGDWTNSEAKAMFNSAFSRGDTLEASVACTVKTIEKNTGVVLDGFMVMDFAGFAEMVDALGGVTMDIPEKMVSSKSNLDLEKGKQKLDGKQALAYARARTFEVGGGSGSDLERIERQQTLMLSIIKEAQNKGMLSDSTQLYSFAGATLDSVTVSENMGSINDLAAFAKSLSSIKTEDIDFQTVPVEDYPADPNRVQWTPKADALWASLKK